MFGPSGVSIGHTYDHSENSVRHELPFVHVHVLKPPGPKAERRRLCVLTLLMVSLVHELRQLRTTKEFFN